MIVEVSGRGIRILCIYSFPLYEFPGRILPSFESSLVVSHIGMQMPDPLCRGGVVSLSGVALCKVMRRSETWRSIRWPRYLCLSSIPRIVIIVPCIGSPQIAVIVTYSNCFVILFLISVTSGKLLHVF